jgi:hypothetical protein
MVPALMVNVAPDGSAPLAVVVMSAVTEIPVQLTGIVSLIGAPSVTVG